MGGNRTMIMRTLCAWATCGVAVAWCMHFGSVAKAQPYTLTDLNTTVQINHDDQAGIDDWDVGGVSHLDHQWFWYRVGPTGPENSLDTLPATVNGFTPTGPLNGLNVTYAGGLGGDDFHIDLDISITGGTAVGTQLSSINEQITITNDTALPLDISFFQYVNMTLGGTSNDTLYFAATTGAPSNLGTFTDGPLSVAEIVATTKPTAYEGAVLPSILNSLNDGGATNLSNTPAVGTTINGDVAMAFQWDFHLTGAGATGSSAQISKIKTLAVIPVPVAVWPGLMMLGLMAVAGGVRRLGLMRSVWS